MNDLINQLFDIATNEEFSESQRKSLMAIAMQDHADAKADQLPSASIMIDEALGAHLTKERTPNGIRFSLK